MQNDYLKAINKRLRPWKKKLEKGIAARQAEERGETLNKDQADLVAAIPRNQILVDELTKARDELIKIQQEKEKTDAQLPKPTPEAAAPAAVSAQLDTTACVTEGTETEAASEAIEAKELETSEVATLLQLFQAPPPLVPPVHAYTPDTPPPHRSSPAPL